MRSHRRPFLLIQCSRLLQHRCSDTQLPNVMEQRSAFNELLVSNREAKVRGEHQRKSAHQYTMRVQVGIMESHSLDQLRDLSCYVVGTVVTRDQSQLLYGSLGKKICRTPPQIALELVIGDLESRQSLKQHIGRSHPLLTV